MPIEEVLDRVEEAGITLTYSPKRDRLVAKPTSAVTPEIIATLREYREEIIHTLDSQTIQSVGEVFDLAREVFPKREDLPTPPSPRDRPDVRM
jgi:hypothetical protein